MKLRETLQHFDASLRFSISLPSVPKISRMSREIERVIGPGVAVELTAPREIIEECQTAINNGNLDTISTKNLRLFCTAGLSALGECTDPVSASNTLLSEVISRSKSSLIKALLLGYLLIADNDAGWVSHLRIFLNSRHEVLAPRWKTRVREYGLLSTDPGAYFSDKFLDEDSQFFDQLSAAGITGVLLTTGIGKCIFRSVMKTLGQSDWVLRPDAAEIFAKLKVYLIQEDRFAFVGSDNQKSLCYGMLEPCTKGDPEDDLLVQIKNMLIGQFSDPRVNPGRWGNVDERHVAVLKRWLTRQSMGLLIEVLNRTADDNHWDVRNDFWSYYLDNDLVDEAWVVFGPEASQHAMDLVSNNPDFSASSFGRFKTGGGSSVQSNHSVLLLRIDDVVVAEWTHNGRVRLWDRRSAKRPNFYQNFYIPDQLRGARNKYTADDEHNHDRSGQWMRKVDRFINRHTGIRHPLNVRSGTDRDAKIQRTTTKNKIAARNWSDRWQTTGNAAVESKSNFSDPVITDPIDLESLTYGKKRCANCKVLKPNIEFFESKKRPGERTKYCKECLQKVMD